MKIVSLLTIFFLLHICSIKSDVTVQYQPGFVAISSVFISPAMNIPGIESFDVISNLGFLPQDDGQGCTTDSYTLSAVGRISVVDSRGCSYSHKIKVAFVSGATGLIIKCLPDIAPGGDYKWAALGISEIDGIILPTVLVSYDDGNSISDEIQVNTATTLITMSSGDTNAWRDAYDSITYLVLVRVIISLLFFISLVFTVWLLITRVYANYVEKNRRGLARILIARSGVYIQYVTIIGCVLGIVYTAVDPFHSVGLIDEIGSQILYLLLIQTPFIVSFMITYIMYSPTTTRVKDMDLVPGRILSAFIIVSAITNAIGITSAILRGLYIIDTTFILIVRITYLVFPACVIIFILIMNSLFYNQVSGPRKFDVEIYRERTKLWRNFAIFSIEIIIVYLLFMAVIAVGFSVNVEGTPQAVISLNCLQLVLLALASFFNTLWAFNNKK
jgi:hypothetical protein